MTGDPVQAAHCEFDRLIPAGPVGVAVSGGGDSMALLTLVSNWAPDRAILAATVDHGLRPESAAEARMVARQCAAIGVPHTVLMADLAAVTGNLAAAARAARYGLLADWARAAGCTSVLLGHTMDDLAETLLMRLARGSGIEGLAAMRESWDEAGILWLRPLLGLRRDALRGVLTAHGTPWCEDPTNDDPAFDRVRVRRVLTDLAPAGIDVPALAASARHILRQRQVLERAMRQLAGRARRLGQLGEAWLDPEAMAGDERDTALRLLADTLKRVSGAPYRPRFAPLEAALDAIVAREAAGTLSGCLIRSEAEGTLICREPAAAAGPALLRDGRADWDRRWSVHAPEIASGALAGALAGVLVGALGAAGLRALAGAEAWAAPENWSQAPRAVRLTTPALWSPNGALLAAPLAEFPPGTRILAENRPFRELPDR